MGTFFVCAIFGRSLIWRLSIDRKWSGREKKWWDREKCPSQVSKSGHSARNYTQNKKLLNELKKIRVNFSTKFYYIFPPKSN